MNIVSNTMDTLIVLSPGQFIVLEAQPHPKVVTELHFVLISYRVFVFVVAFFSAVLEFKLVF